MKTLFIIIFTALTTITLNAQTEFFGMTQKGGDSFGTIFKTDGNGNNHQVLSTFTPNIPGATPYDKLCEASNGKLYGMTQLGGINDQGIIFEHDYTTNAYIKKIDLSKANGSYPVGSLIQASNGKLYGMTAYGGSNNAGVIFEYDYTTNIYTKKIDLSPVNGASPRGSLIQVSSGKLYGMTFSGGNGLRGVIFEYDYTTNTYIKKIDLSIAGGGAPYGSLIEASNGKLYGMTSEGGANNWGVIFEYDYTANTYIKQTDLSYINGCAPYGSLMKASNGKLYGTTSYGGGGDGVIFEYDYITNTYSKKINLSNSNGSRPYGSLMQASNGKLYGMTYYSGANAGGVIFEYDYTANTYIKKIDLSIANGSAPFGSLIQAFNGKLYGMASYGGAYNKGVIFEYNYLTNQYVKKVDFNKADIKEPYGSLIQASNGKMYGMSSGGGVNDLGAIFEYDYITNAYSKKIDFDGTNGGIPIGSLLQASNGKLYGMTSRGGSNNAGVIFEYDYITNIYTKKIDLSPVNGASPRGSLIQVSSGKLYGMTFSGGSNGWGVIFEYDYIANTYVTKTSLDSAYGGGNPIGSLIQAFNGKLFGLTSNGGSKDAGAIFEYDYITNTYSKKIDFDSTNGGIPTGSLLQTPNGKLYGMTSYGGANSAGVIFEYDYTINSYSKKIDFNGTNGSNPYGSLMQASNGKLYGMTSQGGITNRGVLFEYDPVSNSYTKKMDFNGINGASPIYTKLIEINTTTGIPPFSQEVNCFVYPNPFIDKTTISVQGSEFHISEMKIFDVYGKEVKKLKIETPNQELFRNGLPRGVYFYQILSEEKIISSGKLVIQ